VTRKNCTWDNVLGRLCRWAWLGIKSPSVAFPLITPNSACAVRAVAVLSEHYMTSGARGSGPGGGEQWENEEGYKRCRSKRKTRETAARNQHECSSSRSRRGLESSNRQGPAITNHTFKTATAANTRPSSTSLFGNALFVHHLLEGTDHRTLEHALTRRLFFYFCARE